MSKTTKTIVWLIVIIVVIAGIWWGVSRKPAEEEVVKIGIIAPLSGPASTWGEQLRKGIELALDELNLDERKLLRIIYEDSEADPKKAVSAVQKLISVDKVQAIIGPLSSNEVLSVAPIVEKAKVVLLTPTAPHKDIAKAGDYIFRIYPSDEKRSIMLADYTVRELTAKRVGVIYRGDEFGLAVKDEYIQRLKELGLKNNSIITERYEPGNTDFRTIILKVSIKNPEVVLIVGHSKELGFIVRQSHEMGFKPQFLSTADFENPEVLKIAGEAAEGVIYGSIMFNIKSSDSRVKSFRDRYQKFFNTTEEPGIVTALSYDAFNVIYYAIKRASFPSSDNIKKMLYRIKNFPAVTGDITFDEHGDVTKSWGLKIVRNGKFEVLMEKYPQEVQQ